MKASDIYELFNGNGIFPISITGCIDEDECNGLIFEGDFPEYISALTKLGVKTVFVSKRIFSENEINGNFRYELDDEEFEETVSIAEVYPKVVDLKVRIGHPCLFRIFAKIETIELNIFLYEDWYKEFVSESLKALVEFQEKENVKSEEINKSFKQKKDSVIKAIKGLVDDANFTKLPTQRSMIAFAEENISDVSVLEDSELKIEIQKINDILVARGKK